MSKLAIMSDFHMDSNQFSEAELLSFKEVLREEKVTDLHFAGDISNDFDGLSLPYLEELSASFQVSYNLGNHDMVSLSEQSIDEKDFFIKKLGDKTLVAFHGWYDYSFYQGDLTKIEHFKDNFYFDRKIHRDFDDPKTTQILLDKLTQILSQIEGELIVVLHFVPQASFIINTRYEKFQRFNAFLGSKAFHETFVKFPQVKNVVFGHIHQRYQPITIDGIVYHARPLGYIYEWAMLKNFLTLHPDLVDQKIWQPKKRYHQIKQLPDWQAFKEAQLKAEFLSSLTFFEY